MRILIRLLIYRTKNILLNKLIKPINLISDPQYQKMNNI